MTEYKILQVEELKHFIVRDIRPKAVEELKERIKEGFNPSRPLTVVMIDNEFYVANGNHRLKALKELNVNEVPVVIVDDDPYTVAIKGNEDEDTYSPMDLFDWLEVIQRMKDEGLTQQEIGIKLGWNRSKVNDYQAIINNIDENILSKAKAYQLGRSSQNDEKTSFNFSHGWFRNGGLYDLEPKYQELLMNRFIADKFNWNSNKVKSESARYKQWQEFKLIANEKLVNPSDYDVVVELIENGSFKTESQLLDKIKDFNNKADNKLINGDSVIEISKLEDKKIDIIITDPPYGVDYSSNRSKYADNVAKEKIANDNDLDVALELTDNVLKELEDKVTDNAHLYLFTSWKVYPYFLEIVSKYYDVKNLIVWDKGNHGSGDLETSWGNRHELIIFAIKGNRKLNVRKADIIQVSKVNSQVAIHPTQKPTELIKQLLEVSSRPKDTIIDPFMGSGSTIKAVKEYGDLNYIGIELDKDRFDKAVSFIGGD